jgi:hypothetical protein
VLTDGRSPASEAAGELLIALRQAGAASISLPVCATCGKQLRSMRRQGQDWYCAACGRGPARCASCGQDRAAATVDRQGRPRCRQCPDDDDRDPVAILTEVITDLEPSLPAGRIAAAARRAQPGLAKLRRLAWAVEDAPGLLTGDGAHAPMPAVLRLIGELCDAGAQAITRPACPRCHRVIRLALATARQADLDAWLSSEHATYRADAGNFIRWARNHKLTQLDAAAARWSGPSGVIDTETRWEQARWLLHDSTLKPDDRVAGLFVLLYAQWPAAISRLTLGHVDTSDDQVRIRLGREPVILPEPLDALVLQLVATRRGHAAIGHPGTSPWLFPGGQPGQPISAYQLAERLRQLGIRSGQSRSAALFQLATDLPAAILARLLGIHISVAVAWQRAAAGDWAAYAADIGHRLEH